MDDLQEKIKTYQSDVKSFGRIRRLLILVFVLLFFTCYGISTFIFI